MYINKVYIMTRVLILELLNTNLYSAEAQKLPGLQLQNIVVWSLLHAQLIRSLLQPLNYFEVDFHKLWKN